MAATLENLTQRIEARREFPTPAVRRALRKATGASQADVAAVCGVTRQAVQLWEAGTRTPRGANLDRYLEVLQAFKRAMSATPSMREPDLSRAQDSRDNDNNANATATS